MAITCDLVHGGGSRTTGAILRRTSYLHDLPCREQTEAKAQCTGEERGGERFHWLVPVWPLMRPRWFLIRLMMASMRSSLACQSLSFWRSAVSLGAVS